jgi:hypothetical protein
MLTIPLRNLTFAGAKELLLRPVFYDIIHYPMNRIPRSKTSTLSQNSKLSCVCTKLLSVPSLFRIKTRLCIFPIENSGALIPIRLLISNRRQHNHLPFTVEFNHIYSLNHDSLSFENLYI